MHKCNICGKEYPNPFALESHWAGHAVRPVREEPLSYLLCLPDGVTAGRYEAAEAFAKAYAELREKHPDTPFHFFPFSYGTVGGEHPALNAILAIAD